MNLGKEIELNTELSELLFDDTDFKSIASPMIHRAFRRNPETKLKLPCPACNDRLNGLLEGQIDCPYCLGYGALFDDRIIKGFLYRQNYLREQTNLKMATKAGKNDNSAFTLATDKDTFLEIEDKVLIVELRPDGRITVPLNITLQNTVYFSRNMLASGTNCDYNIAIIAS